ncbi:NfeD family protein [Phosphitispora sp. TUW77]|uniref:NfeD family protein n=1 Tax=Phosphitispora sp. TUW77 TaxID=3152361 RepID=UPI003AB2BA3F
MKNRSLRIICCLAIIIVGFMLWTDMGSADTSVTEIVFIPVKGQIEPGLAGFVERSITRAESSGAAKIILEIDTPGGLIESAQSIKKAAFSAKIPIAAFVTGQAKSAGVLISLSGDKIYMMPGSSIGAAEPIPNTPKILGSWISDLESAASAHGRNTIIVRGMADRELEVKDIKKAGEILSLSADKAVELGVADRVVRNRNALIAELEEEDGLNYNPVEYKPGFGETLAWWTVNPFISPILLMVGFAGLITEVFVPGFGVPGIVGLISLGVYFAGHMMAGVTGWLAVFVFVIGVIAVLLEIFVIPGFGAAGLLGLGMVIWSVFLASTSPQQAVISLTAALVGSIVMLYIFIKVLGRRGMWDKLILGMKLDTATGYITPKRGMEKYQGMEGTAVTPLRPAGTAEFAGDRVDVVSEGGFIPAGTPVRVVLVEGSRVVVKEA